MACRSSAAERSRILVVFPALTWPRTDGTRAQQLHADVAAVLVDGVMPTQRTAALVSLLAALDAAPVLFPDTNRRDVKKRAKEIAEGEWAGKAVRSAVEAVNVAVLAGATTATSAVGG